MGILIRNMINKMVVLRLSQRYILWFINRQLCINKVKPNGLTIPIDVVFTIKYDLSLNDWRLENRISEIRIAEYEGFTYVSKLYYQASLKERERIKNSNKF